MDVKEKGQDIQRSGAEVAETASASASEIRDQASEQFRSVAETAKEETRQTIAGLGEGLQHEVNEQSLRIAQVLDGLSGELDEMAQNGSGWASAVVGDTADKTRDLARWVERTEPRDMVRGVEDFARRRPVAFVLGSALAGVIVGRLTRSMVASSDGSGSPQQGRLPGYASDLDLRSGVRTEQRDLVGDVPRSPVPSGDLGGSGNITRSGFEEPVS